MSDKNWHAGYWDLPAEIADAIEPALPGLGAEMIASISVEVPEYARPLEGSFGRGVRLGVEEALKQFVATVRDPESGRGAGREVYVELGRGELRQGRSLDALLSAYRVGARVAWRRLSEAAEQAGFPSPVVYSLADAIFAYIDELSAESAEGFAAEQSEQRDQTRISRDRLLASLLHPDPPPSIELDRLAAEAGWAPPEEVVALACGVEDMAALSRGLPAGTISGGVDGLGCILLSAAQAAGAGSASSEGIATTQGFPVAWRNARRSWEDARSVHALRVLGSDALSDSGLLITEEVLTSAILLDAAPRLRRLASRRLAPMAEETPASRKRLQETLEALLRNQGRINDTATALHVHPQTVRYRMARLRELFGPDLDDPDTRFELEMVLRARGSGNSATEWFPGIDDPSKRSQMRMILEANDSQAHR